jgi:hypothetical protein
MSFIAQLEAVGGCAHWAVYAALHIPEAQERARVSRNKLLWLSVRWYGCRACALLTLADLLPLTLLVPKCLLCAVCDHMHRCTRQHIVLTVLEQ